jgi:type II secretory pathway pseudopilin PulG
VLKLLALLAICGLVVALLLPTVRSSSEAARRNSCLNNLKQIGLALRNYADAQGHFPPAYTTDADGNPLHSWRTLILPYLEQRALFNTIDLTKPWDDPANANAASSRIQCYECPSMESYDAKSPLTSYLAVVGADSVIRATDSRTWEAVEAVAAHTLLVIDAPKEHAVHWMSPEDADETAFAEMLKNDKAPSQHAGNIILALFADGHVAAISKETDPAALRAMTTVSSDDGGDVKE